MFNRKKCKVCVYSMKFTGGGVQATRDKTLGIMCGYSLITHETCLKYDVKTDTKSDLRGKDPNHCLLFKKGDRLKNELLH